MKRSPEGSDFSELADKKPKKKTGQKTDQAVLESPATKAPEQFEGTAYEDAPLGWKTANGLAVELGAQYQFVVNKSETYRGAHPDWFKDYIRVGGKKRVYEHLAPALVNEITTWFKNLERPPQGWMTNLSIAHMLGVTGSPVEVIANRFRDEEHASWFHFMWIRIIGCLSICTRI